MNSAADSPNYNEAYYRTHKDEIAERRRLKYQEDEEYRQRCIERAKERYKKNRKKIRKANRKQSMVVFPSGEMEKALQMADLCDSIGKRPFTVRGWIRNGSIPESPLKRGRLRYYTKDMIRVVKRALPKTFRKDWEAVSDAIEHGWSALGVYDEGVAVKSV